MSQIAAQTQLNAVGPQEKDLYDPPTASLFTYNYKKITNYAKSTVPLIFNENYDFGKTLTVNIPHQGDAIGKMWIYFRLPVLTVPVGSTYVGWTNTVGYALIESVELLLGNIVIDKHTDISLELTDYLSIDQSKRLAHDKAIGRFDTNLVLDGTGTTPTDVYIPLPWWFTKKMSSVFPLFMLTEHTMKIRIKLRNFGDVLTYDGNIPPDYQSIIAGHLLTEYYILDEKDKERMESETSLTYLIEQTHMISEEINANTPLAHVKLDFNNAVKEIVWIVRETDSEDNNDWFNYGRREPDFLTKEFFNFASLTLDGKQRFIKLRETYYREVTSEEYHTFSGDRNIYIMSFASNPQANQPSGSIDFSRFDNIVLTLDFVPNVPQSRVMAMAVSYNTLTISKGKVSLGYI